MLVGRTCLRLDRHLSETEPCTQPSASPRVPPTASRGLRCADDEISAPRRRPWKNSCAAILIAVILNQPSLKIARGELSRAERTLVGGLPAFVVAGQLPSQTGWNSQQPILILPPQLPTNGRVRELRFSPDGRYILAREDSALTVVSTQPLEIVFRLLANNVSAAGFTSESAQVWFVTDPMYLASHEVTLLSRPAARLQRWTITDKILVDSIDLDLRSCETSELSPDGHLVACVDSNGRLRIVEASSGRLLFEKRNFGTEFVVDPDGTRANLRTWGDLGSAKIGFSPDSRFFLGHPWHADGPALAWDAKKARPVSLKGGLSGRRYGTSVFTSPDSVLLSRVVLGHDKVDARLVSFPSGKVLLKVKVPPGWLHRASDPGFVIVRPFGRFARDSDPVQRAAAVEFATGTVIISRSQALDVRGKYYVTEDVQGRIALFERGKGELASISLIAH
jgi:hypothetical protein